MESIVTLLKSSNIFSDQKTRIKRARDESFYLIKKNIVDDQIILKITGTTLNIYTITIEKGQPITCDCIDSCTRCHDYGLFCKHACFVYLKIGRIKDDSLFIKKKLLVKHYNTLKQRLNNCWEDTEIVNKELINKFDRIIKGDETSYELLEIFKPIGMRNIEDDCPVCFNSLKEGDTKKCPKCENGVHLECVKRWLLNHNNCVYCRDDIWELMKKKKNNTNDEDGYLNIS